jgi:hypothetical protein
MCQAAEQLAAASAAMAGSPSLRHDYIRSSNTCPKCGSGGLNPYVSHLPTSLGTTVLCSLMENKGLRACTDMIYQSGGLTKCPSGKYCSTETLIEAPGALATVAAWLKAEPTASITLCHLNMLQCLFVTLIMV